ncbi:myosin light chain kinase 2, skeletal/cardiac muscle-like [Pan troglodytes]|uniref:myosin light chain kinase 2, skeletal/cardiac muscle-like n=1 Tax=Pan troglodytes TaxID=9598 RepID=UPI0023F33EE2|nr:myosin light chain kinase 2, skeletal/cardiac muscle-like [Pan troglodytes]XP_054538477.1 myosin light chain kinase 2, skeletal/cardiac muscle-like [Pan troglodytes]
MHVCAFAGFLRAAHDSGLHLLPRRPPFCPRAGQDRGPSGPDRAPRPPASPATAQDGGRPRGSPPGRDSAGAGGPSTGECGRRAGRPEKMLAQLECLKTNPQSVGSWGRQEGNRLGVTPDGGRRDHTVALWAGFPDAAAREFVPAVLTLSPQQTLQQRKIRSTCPRGAGELGFSKRCSRGKSDPPARGVRGSSVSANAAAEENQIHLPAGCGGARFQQTLQHRKIRSTCLRGAGELGFSKRCSRGKSDPPARGVRGSSVSANAAAEENQIHLPAGCGGARFQQTLQRRKIRSTCPRGAGELCFMP